MRRPVLIVSLTAGVALLNGAGGVSARSTPPRPAHAASSIRLIVVHAADGETAALAPVVIHGHVFPFLIDTGATRSVVDLALARRLRLGRVGAPIRVSGVGCTSTAHNVHLADWRIGTQPLPTILATSTRIAGANGKAFGLLGSDVLSRFGAATIDYAHARLILG
ncbi:MAG: retroviral-like aspartic protease family protein [Actinomycetota bacterium]|nr:retroviral-like aspartic protease family protein [Actinomycetota bacterium]